MTQSTPLSKPELVHVDLGSRSYDIQIGRGWIAGLGPTLRELCPGARFLLVSNPVVSGLWGEAVLKTLREAEIDVEQMTIPEGEAHKSINTVTLIHDKLVEGQYDRQTVVVALGGGVVGDITGFAAASFLRGVDLVQIPSSLLSMVDSSVGGKTGVNHRLGKNLIGAFKQPRFVGIELEMLQTLPPVEFACGMAEIIKYGVISDPDLFSYLDAERESIRGVETEAVQHIVRRSCEIKADVVRQDETEKGLRAILNFGHTFAHAVENLTGYDAVRHGEAVGMGMVAACRLGEAVAHFPAESTGRVCDMVAAYGLPTELPRLPVEDYLRVMQSDKKVHSGQLRFIVPTRIGHVELRDDIEQNIIIDVLNASFTDA